MNENNRPKEINPMNPSRIFPVTLYHKDNGTPEFRGDARHSHHPEYPIVVWTQADVDRLGPGWYDNPIEAAQWNETPTPTPTTTADEPKEESKDESTDEPPTKKRRRS